MRERLIAKIDKFCKKELGTKFYKNVLEMFADYLLDNGVIVPPCKVGDVVKCDEIYYHIYRMQAYEDYETPIHYRYWAEPTTDEGEDDFWFWSDRLDEGTVIVCSKEEAEAKLKEGAE